LCGNAAKETVEVDGVEYQVSCFTKYHELPVRGYAKQMKANLKQLPSVSEAADEPAPQGNHRRRRPASVSRGSGSGSLFGSNGDKTAGKKDETADEAEEEEEEPGEVEETAGRLPVSSSDTPVSPLAALPSSPATPEQSPLHTPPRHSDSPHHSDLGRVHSSPDGAVAFESAEYWEDPNSAFGDCCCGTKARRGVCGCNGHNSNREELRQSDVTNLFNRWVGDCSDDTIIRQAVMTPDRRDAPLADGSELRVGHLRFLASNTYPEGSSFLDGGSRPRWLCDETIDGFLSLLSQRLCARVDDDNPLRTYVFSSAQIHDFVAERKNGTSSKRKAHTARRRKKREKGPEGASEEGELEGTNVEVKCAKSLSKMFGVNVEWDKITTVVIPYNINYDPNSKDDGCHWVLVTLSVPDASGSEGATGTSGQRDGRRGGPACDGSPWHTLRMWDGTDACTAEHATCLQGWVNTLFAFALQAGVVARRIRVNSLEVNRLPSNQEDSWSCAHRMLAAAVDVTRHGVPKVVRCIEAVRADILHSLVVAQLSSKW
jgi:hypothetical protein